MAALDDLKAVWQSRIAQLTDDAARAEASVALDDFIAAKAAHAAAVSARLSSYGIQGRSATRRDPAQLLRDADTAMSRLTALVYGGYHRVDMSQVARTDLPISGV